MIEIICFSLVSLMPLIYLTSLILNVFQISQIFLTVLKQK